jgi:hypothetical protein
MKSKTCCLCNAEFEGYGCNPAPLADAGSCCNKCDNLKVVPARLVELGTPRSSADSIGKTFWKIHTSRVWKKMIKDGLLKEVK